MLVTVIQLEQTKGNPSMLLELTVELNLTWNRFEIGYLELGFVEFEGLNTA